MTLVNKHYDSKTLNEIYCIQLYSWCHICFCYLLGHTLYFSVFRHLIVRSLFSLCGSYVSDSLSSLLIFVISSFPTSDYQARCRTITRLTCSLPKLSVCLPHTRYQIPCLSDYPAPLPKPLPVCTCYRTPACLPARCRTITGFSDSWLYNISSVLHLVSISFPHDTWNPGIV